MKIKYIAPKISKIKLDNAFSLQLASISETPPGGRNEAPRINEMSSNGSIDSDPYQYEGW